ncbi:MAG: hypothetical protein K8T25_20910, partial [Planctomycetia bacterium]|nr:hypothetical protein [Planctomycetia bacterium]
MNVKAMRVLVSVIVVLFAIICETAKGDGCSGQVTIIDNEAATYTPSMAAWTRYTAAGYGSNDFRYISTVVGGTTNSATYTFTVQDGQSYKVYATWYESASRSGAVPYVINYGVGSTTVTVNQKNAPAAGVAASPKNFQLLTTVTTSGTSLTVTLKDSPSSAGYLVADAVRIECQGSGTTTGGTTTGGTTTGGTTTGGTTTGGSCTPSTSLCSLDQTYVFYTDGTTTYSGAPNVVWIRGNTNAYGNGFYVITSTGDLRAWAGGALTNYGPVIANVCPSAYANPALLYNALDTASGGTCGGGTTGASTTGGVTSGGGGTTGGTTTGGTTTGGT